LVFGHPAFIIDAGESGGAEMRRKQVLSLFAVFIAALTVSWPAAADENVAALLKRQSQEFSDASASGDAAVLNRYLDDRVIFINESGIVSTKKDIVASAGPSPKGVHFTLTQTDWAVQLYGPTAVTSFTDVQNGRAYGQALHAKFRSTEVWLKEGAGWRMISSQTIALQDDPPAVALPVKELDGYVGVYRGGPDFSYTITRSGDELSASLSGGPPSVLKAELRDVFFTPGQPRVRKIFQRDANGRITGFVSRHEGHDLVFKRIG
jgi:ketosteroid isomerase-like protein